MSLDIGSKRISVGKLNRSQQNRAEMVDQGETGHVGELTTSGNEGNSVHKEEAAFVSWTTSNLHKKLLCLERPNIYGVDRGVSPTGTGLKGVAEKGISVKEEEERSATKDDDDRRILQNTGWNISRSLRKNGRVQWYYRSPDGWLGSSLSAAMFKWRLLKQGTSSDGGLDDKITTTMSGKVSAEATCNPSYTEEFNELKRRKIEGSSSAAEEHLSILRQDRLEGTGRVFDRFVSRSQKASLAVNFDQTCDSSGEVRLSFAGNVGRGDPTGLQRNSLDNSDCNPPAMKSINPVRTDFLSQELKGRPQLMHWAGQPGNSNIPQGIGSAGSFPLGMPVVDDHSRPCSLAEQQPSGSGKDGKQGSSAERKEVIGTSKNPLAVEDDDERRRVLKNAGWNISQSIRKSGKVQWYYRSPNGCLSGSSSSAMSKWIQMNEESSSQRGNDNESSIVPIAKKRKKPKKPQPSGTDPCPTKSRYTMSSKDKSFHCGPTAVERAVLGVQTNDSKRAVGFQEMVGNSQRNVDHVDTDECLRMLRASGWRISQNVRKNGKVQWYFRSPTGCLLSSLPSAMNEWRKVNEEQKQVNSIDDENKDTVAVNGCSSEIYKAWIQTSSPSIVHRKTESEEIDSIEPLKAKDINENRGLKLEVMERTRDTSADCKSVSRATDLNIKMNDIDNVDPVMGESEQSNPRKRSESLVEQAEKNPFQAFVVKGDPTWPVDEKSRQQPKKLLPRSIEASPPKRMSILNSQRGSSLLGRSGIEDTGYMDLLRRAEGARDARPVHLTENSYLQPRLSSLSHQDVSRIVKNSPSSCPSTSENNEGMQILKDAGWRISQSIRKNGRVQWYFRSPNGCLLSTLSSALGEWTKSNDEMKQRSFHSNYLAQKSHISDTEPGQCCSSKMSKASSQMPSTSSKDLDKDKREQCTPMNVDGYLILKTERSREMDPTELLTTGHVNGDIIVNSDASPRAHVMMSCRIADNHVESVASKLDCQSNVLEIVDHGGDQPEALKIPIERESSRLAHGQSATFQVSIVKEGPTENLGFGTGAQVTPVQSSTLLQVGQALLKKAVAVGDAEIDNGGMSEKTNKSWTWLTEEMKLLHQGTRLLSPEIV